MQLGFLQFEVSDPAAWDGFLTNVLGLTGAGDGRYRNDGYAYRFIITEGPSDDLATIGWECADNAELDGCVAALREAGYAVEAADSSPRGCTRRFLVTDPSGVPLELVSGLPRTSSPLDTTLVPGGFVAGDMGLGHLVITAPDPAASRAFYDLLGFRLSDRIVTEVYGHPVDLSFFHVNGRHHSLAFGGPQRKRLHHFMVEARNVDDVGACYDRAIKSGTRIMQTLGRHPNDRMFSYYARTPSKFQYEFGHGGRVIDDATWDDTTVYDRISEWGHHPPQMAFPGTPRGTR